MSEAKPRKVGGRSVAVVLGIVCIILVAGLGAVICDKNSTISSQNSQISNLNNVIASQNDQIAQQNTTITNQNSTINRLAKLENLANQIFFLGPQPYDSYSFEWAGTWNLVATFGGTSFQEKTSTFSIYSPYHIWRLNYSQTGEDQGFCSIFVHQVIGSQELAIKNWQVTGTDKFTSYIFDYGISSPDNYYIGMATYTGVHSWTITIEQLNLK
jgi:hypothetical protein